MYVVWEFPVTSQDKMTLSLQFTRPAVNKRAGKTGNNMEQADFVAAIFDDDRIRLPPDLSELAQLKGTEPIACWLLVVTVGRYRLVPQPVAGDAGSESFTALLREWEEAASPGDILDGTEGNKRAAMRARLIATEALPTRSGWRIKVPKEVRKLLPPEEDDSFVFLLLVGGFIELWFPDTLRRALSAPIADPFA